MKLVKVFFYFNYTNCNVPVEKFKNKTTQRTEIFLYYDSRRILTYEIAISAQCMQWWVFKVIKPGRGEIVYLKLL